LWRWATIFSLIFLAVAVATGWSMMEQFKAQLEHLQHKLKSTPQVRFVSVLLDAQHEPAQLITYDPQDHYLLIQRLNDVKEGQEDSMQLWALDDNDRPLSLGIINRSAKTAQVRVTDDVMEQTKNLAVSVEKREGADPGKPPLLPYLFKGALIRKAL
jgi:anti-sigma-K factor RskA